jgi:hypothetical protein
MRVLESHYINAFWKQRKVLQGWTHMHTGLPLEMQPKLQQCLHAYGRDQHCCLIQYFFVRVRTRKSSRPSANSFDRNLKILLPKTGSGAHPAFCPMSTGGYLPGERGRRLKLTTHIHLVPRSRMVEPYLHFPICLHDIVLK